MWMQKSHKGAFRSQCLLSALLAVQVRCKMGAKSWCPLAENGYGLQYTCGRAGAGERGMQRISSNPWDSHNKQRSTFSAYNTTALQGGHHSPLLVSWWSPLHEWEERCRCFAASPILSPIPSFIGKALTHPAPRGRRG